MKSIGRRKFLCWLQAGLAASALPGFAAARARNGRLPNIVLIVADDLGYSDLGSYGAGRVPTPHCDALARDGMRFIDANAPASACTPTRYGVLTGRYSWRTWLRHGVINDRMPLLIEPGRLTIGSMLQGLGYATGCIGKWHLGWGRRPDDFHKGILQPGPLECGFDYYYGVPFSHNSPPAVEVYVRNRDVVGLQDGESILDREVQKRIRRRLEDTAVNLSLDASWFIRRNREKPFFLYYPTTGVHRPWTPHERFRGRSGMGLYGDSVVEFDWAVGQVMSALDYHGLAEDTLLIVTSDNGARDGTGSNKPWRGSKGGIYQGGHRVPFLARWPGRIEPGSVSRETICLTDLIATFADIAGVTLGNDAAEDSESFLPALHGQALQRQREGIVLHSVSGMFAIRSGRWKLIEGLGDGDTEFHIHLYKKEARGLPVVDEETGEIQPLSYRPEPFPRPRPGEPPGQLYDLAKDPKESRNVYEAYPEVVAALQSLLDAYRDSGRSVIRA